LENVYNDGNFLKHFYKNLEYTRKLLHKEPCLIQGFQVFLDKRGSLYHLDFDCCFLPNDLRKKRKVSKNKIKSCFDGLDKIEITVSETLGVMNPPLPNGN
jgi:hypothetical protein